MSVRKDIHFGGLGFFLDFARRWWKKPSRKDAINRTRDVMERIFITGIQVVDFFTFVSDWSPENRYISGMEPWKRTGLKRKFDFDEPRKKFYTCYKKFCELLKEHHLRPCATLLLRPPYFHTLLENNKQGITSVTDARFIDYMIDMNDRIMNVELGVWGMDHAYNQWRKISNEWSHHDYSFGHTPCDRGHFIADFHKDMFDESLDISVPLPKHIIDITASEFAKAYFSQPSVCPYCDEEVYDRPDLRGTGNDPDGVAVLLEQHGYSVPDNLNPNAEDANDRHHAHAYIDFLYHNPHVQRIRLHEDGGGGVTANGYAVGNFVIGDNEQSYEFAKTLWTFAKDARKQVVYAIFPLETLQEDADGEFRENYHVDVINWDRIDGIITAYKEVYGG